MKTKTILSALTVLACSYGTAMAQVPSGAVRIGVLNDQSGTYSDIGGMGSVSGALVGALLIGLIRSFGTIGFPLFVEGLMFLAMVLILILRPNGLLGKESRA